ncbi:YggT family protein [Methylomarinovum caldicuralii]|uniref:YggT family protein n=2 Tax=Methylomarinovum TaxID=1486720 RepID=A0AAU9C932_9GAMM|nr:MULTISPECIES: YggT family protein [Methylomarinovum]BCX82529.1 YggT family protein [Methylomarinovum caldicuralii]BCX89785.1 YggT family protein [Methylomarinovum sp. IN45]
MSGYLADPAVFVVNVLFSLYILAVMLRFLFQLVEADFYNPISQALVKITHPPLRLLRRFIPAIGRVDTASLVFMLLLQVLADYLVYLLQGGGRVAIGVLVASALIQLVNLAFNVFIYAIIIQAVMSWINPDPYNPVYALLTDLTEPVLRPCRRLIPALGGLDLSPLLALVGLQVLKMLILPPLQKLVLMLAF